MIKNKISTLLLVTLIILVSGIDLASASTTMNIYAISPTNTPFTNTTIVVNHSVPITITADPTLTWSTGVTTSGPNGDATYSPFYDSIGVTWIHYPIASFGELIAYVGDTPMAGGAHYWAIGDGATFTPDISGSLWLGINDDNDGGGIDDNSGYMTVTIGPSLEVTTSTDTINLTDTPKTQGGGSDICTPKSATIDILVRDSNGEPMKDTAVRIYAITEPGSGGHTHDLSRSPDSQTDSNGATRAMATLQASGATGTKNDIIVKTNSSGQVSVNYIPPSFVTLTNINRVVAGIDKIKVELPDYPSVSKVEKKISVRYQDFVPVSDKNVTLQAQTNHDMEFYCTTGTMGSISRIASEFKKQTGIETQISATSLPWGGLCDVDGDWAIPHVEHQNGKAVDFALTYYNDKANAIQIKKTLKKIIQDDPNFRNFNPGEDKIEGDHLHARFTT